MQKDDLKRYFEAVYHRCYRILRDRDLAWDALQDVFEQYYQACLKQEIQQPLAYLYRMSTNRCLNILRRERRLLPLGEEVERSEGPTDGPKVEGRLMVDALFQAFGEEAIHLLVYRHVDQMTYGEIASLVGMSDRGVKKKIERLEQQIRERFEG